MNDNIADQLNQMWQRAENPACTTSQRMEHVDKVAAEKYRIMRDKGYSHEEIMKELSEIKSQLKNQSGGKVWAWAKNVLKHAASEADKIRID